MRNATDTYVTTPEAAEVLRLHLGIALQRGQWLDPAAGFGTLLEWAGVPRSRRWAIELAPQPERRRELDERIQPEQLTIGDALAVQWPASVNILANPPYNLLDSFVARILDRARGIAAVLTPVAWWHAQSRRKIPAPSTLLALTWRPNFSTGLRADGTNGGQPSQDYVWAIWGPDWDAGGTSWLRVDRPTVSREATATHERLARLAAGLPGYAAAPLLDGVA